MIILERHTKDIKGKAVQHLHDFLAQYNTEKKSLHLKKKYS